MQSETEIITLSKTRQAFLTIFGGSVTSYPIAWIMDSALTTFLGNVSNPTLWGILSEVKMQIRFPPIGRSKMLLYFQEVHMEMNFSFLLIY